MFLAKLFLVFRASAIGDVIAGIIGSILNKPNTARRWGGGLLTALVALIMYLVLNRDIPAMSPVFNGWIGRMIIIDAASELFCTDDTNFLTIVYVLIQFVCTVIGISLLFIQ